MISHAAIRTIGEAQYYVLDHLSSFSQSIIDDLLEKFLSLPQTIVLFIVEIILLLIYITMFIGLLLIIWGALEWLSGWNEISGKKNIIRGVALLLLASALGIYI